jgi:hypothetical protein
MHLANIGHRAQVVRATSPSDTKGERPAWRVKVLSGHVSQRAMSHLCGSDPTRFGPLRRNRGRSRVQMQIRALRYNNAARTYGLGSASMPTHTKPLGPRQFGAGPDRARCSIVPTNGFKNPEPVLVVLLRLGVAVMSPAHDTEVEQRRSCLSGVVLRLLEHLVEKNYGSCAIRI